MSIRNAALVFTLTLIVGAILPPSLEAQGIGSRIRSRAQQAAEREVERKVDELVTDAVRCALGDTACVDSAKESGENVVIVDDDGQVITDGNGNPVTNQDEAALQMMEPGTGVWRNYDFVPGRDVWFASNFAAEPVGRFPASQLEFISGNGQIVEMNGESVLEITANTTFLVHLPGDLPEDFTIEFYGQTAAPNISIDVYFDPLTEMGLSRRQYDKHYMSVWRGGGLYLQAQAVSTKDGHWEVAQELVPVKLQADGGYAVMYMGTDRVGNLPNASFGQSNVIEFFISANQSRPAYIRDIVVAVGLDKLYESLLESGEFTTRGILFGVDSDVLRPESTPVLEDIRRTLADHADLERVVIEGHTDDTGDDAHNQDLSERRAAAVKAYLVANGIEADRIESVGRGETVPVADNASPEGRQQNRRVVVRLPDGA